MTQISNNTHVTVPSNTIFQADNVGSLGGAGIANSVITLISGALSLVLGPSVVNAGNSTVNATMNATTLVVANSTVTLTLARPNTTQVSAGNYFFNANSSWSQVPSLTQTDFVSGIIAVPSNKDYRLLLKVPVAFTITETVTRTASGSATATFKINTTALGGTPNAANTTEQAQTHSSSNSVAVDDDVVLTVSSASSPSDLSFTIKFTRTLA
jgi:hypothetical protein